MNFLKNIWQSIINLFNKEKEMKLEEPKSAEIVVPSNIELPLSVAQAKRCAKWMRENFSPQLKFFELPPFDMDHFIAIALQETAYFWASFIESLSPPEVLARCVLDASGDVPGTSRSAFPKNTQAFKDAFGDAFADLLIDEGNKSRRIRGYNPWDKIYKGYGIFQYDLQYVKTDKDFFLKKQWYFIEECLIRLRSELKAKLKLSGGDVKGAIRRYNGAGAAANKYAENVMVFYAISKSV